MKIGIKKTVDVEAKTLKLHLKVRDEFNATILDQDGATIKRYSGYVPGFMPGEHHGDYLFLDIDVDTGTINNWTPPTAKEIEAFVDGSEDE